MIMSDTHIDTEEHRSGRNLDGLPDLLTIKELSVWAQIPVSTLYQWNFKDYGLRPIKFGKHLRYPREEVRRWTDSLDRRNWPPAA